MGARASDMRIGMLTLPTTSWDDLLAEWRALDALGIRTAWIADHLRSPYDAAAPWLDGWTALGAIARETSRIRLGTLVSSLTLRNPVAVAKQSVTLDYISGGRFELGLGASNAVSDYEISGTPVWSVEERLARFREFVPLVARLLHEDVEAYEGTYYRTREARLHPRPVQARLPLTIAGHTRAALELAARHATRWNSYGGETATPADSLRKTRERNERLDTICFEIGRDPAEIVRSFILGYSYVPETPFASRDAFDDFVGRYRDAGMNELMFFYPLERYSPPGTVRPGLLETVLADTAVSA